MQAVFPSVYSLSLLRQWRSRCNNPPRRMSCFSNPKGLHSLFHCAVKLFIKGAKATFRPRKVLRKCGKSRPVALPIGLAHAIAQGILDFHKPTQVCQRTEHFRKPAAAQFAQFLSRFFCIRLRIFRPPSCQRSPKRDRRKTGIWTDCRSRPARPRPPHRETLPA